MQPFQSGSVFKLMGTVSARNGRRPYGFPPAVRQFQKKGYYPICPDSSAGILPIRHRTEKALAFSRECCYDTINSVPAGRSRCRFAAGGASSRKDSSYVSKPMVWTHDTMNATREWYHGHMAVGSCLNLEYNSRLRLLYNMLRLVCRDFPRMA